MTSLLPGSLLCLAVFMIDAGDLDRVSVLALLLTKHMAMSNSILTCHMSSAGDEIIPSPLQHKFLRIRACSLCPL